MQILDRVHIEHYVFVRKVCTPIDKTTLPNILLSIIGVELFDVLFVSIVA